MKNNMTGEYWRWTHTEMEDYYGHKNFFAASAIKFLVIIRLFFGYFLCSAITAIYIKITIICSPMFILMTCKSPACNPLFLTLYYILDSCCNRNGSINLAARLNVYRAFPWIGVYLYALLANGHKKQSYMIFAFVCLMVVFYCLYLSAISIWSFLLFGKSIPRSLDENFYGFIAFLEFATLMLVRTRSTIKWLPRFALVPILSFLYYVQYSAYGFSYQALYLLVASVTGIFAYHLRIFEIPALSWNPFHHYTPTAESPRALFFPLFSLSWYHDLPQLWTMFYPLFGRSMFTQSQLAMVNQNNALLQQTLEEALQRGQNMANDQNMQEMEEAANLANQNNGNPNDSVLDAEPSDPVDPANNQP